MPSMADRQKLRDAWAEALRPFAPRPEDAEEVFGELVTRYSGPTRHYHTLSHINAMWDTLDGIRRQVAIRDVTAVHLALWFHDAIYDSRARDNEEHSALLARTTLPHLRVPPATVAAVERLILATQTHQAAMGDTDCQALLDCDLAVLGASEQEYDAYARAIRREYAWVADADYRTGRSKVLDAFLRRELIYLTPPMRDRLEHHARKNLRRELDALRAS